MARIICPFCLKTHDVTDDLQCPETGYDIADTFVSEYKTVPPLWMVTVGFSQHGKTVFQAALTLMLEEIGSVWPDVYCDYLNDYTAVEVRKMREEAISGEQPTMTPVSTSLPKLMSVYNLPYSGSRCLVMYDVGGEAFETTDMIKENVAAIRHCRTILFLISLSDLRDSTRTISELFSVYMRGMKQLRTDLQDRNLIVVFTKADMYDFPEDVKDYLRSDELKNLTNRNEDMLPQMDFKFQDYVENLEYISGRLHEFTMRQRGGSQFVSMAKAQGMRVKFCLTSALGSTPDNSSNKMRESATRYRVLDPLIWALHLQNSGPASAATSAGSMVSSRQETFNIILDASAEGSKLYADNLPQQLWESLGENSEINTYIMGQAQPIAQAEQKPPDRLARTSRPRLIGPVLERIKSGKTILISDQLPLDMVDFRNSAWKENLTFVALKEGEFDWANVFHYRSPDDFEPLINTLSK